ncbi:hypothetical protein V5O48_003377 [Marasmius crinis-equi]|uniref:CRAL-TRIO domain-containing protein n=1 Tax=Marasmius crinis-equi TaxID=585013 RepID=A0ABR3FTV5_9AGAR
MSQLSTEAKLDVFRKELFDEGILKEGDSIGTDDDTLKRFLRARKYDLVQAKKMIREAQHWRKTVEGVGIDELYNQIDPFDYPERKAVFECWPMWFHKTDKLGRPLNVHYLGAMNVKKLYSACSPERHWQTVLANAESLTREVIPAAVRVHGESAKSVFVVVDLDGFSLGQFWQMKGLVQKSFQMSQDYYPETMGSLFVINAPPTFTLIWSAIKPWLAKETVEKTDILGKDYKARLLELVDAENLPSVLGGNCTCEEAGGCQFSAVGPWLEGRKGWGPNSSKTTESEPQPPDSGVFLAEPKGTDLLGIYQSPTFSPFRIHSGTLDTPDIATVLFSSRNRESKPSPEKMATSMEFDLWTAKLGISDFEQPNSEAIRTINALWCRKGEEPPIFSSFDSSGSLFAVISGSVFRERGEASLPSYTPSPDELAPIPRANENLDENNDIQTKPHPYSWTQTPDSLTVAFPLPSTTQKSQIQVKLTSDSLSLAVTGLEESDLPITLPRYASKPLWDRIMPSSSYWTWDREAEHEFGILSLHLDKQNEGTKWVQLFATAGNTTAAEAAPDDAEVPETLDPSELWHVRESMEKFTAALRSGEDASGLGLGTGVPSLAEGEMDEEVDASVGRKAYVSWLGRDDGAPPSWSSPGQEVPFQLLSAPLPGNHSDPTLSLIVKEGLDGAVFALNPSAEAKWKHTSTFSALAFVLASKRDIRFTHHSRDTVYALESGSINRGGNAYIYRMVPRGERWAKQAILRVADGSGGALLGVGSVVVRGTRVITCLAEKELILLKV